MMLPWAHPDQHPGLDHLAAAVLRVDEFDPSFGGDHDHVEVHPMLGCLLPGREDQVGDVRDGSSINCSNRSMFLFPVM